MFVAIFLIYIIEQNVINCIMLCATWKYSEIIPSRENCHLRQDEHTQRQGWGAYYPFSGEDLRYFLGIKAQHLSGVTQPSLNLSHFSCPCLSMEHRRKDNVVPHMDISRWIFKGFILNICVQYFRWKQVWSFLQALPRVFEHLNTTKSLFRATNPLLRRAGRHLKTW